jgi:glycerophosphoryl diester phosphodiesterase
MPTLTWESFKQRPRSASPLIMAHRGAADDLPENTLAAFGLALEQGADALETDLRFSRDNELVLMHDASVERTTEGSGAVASLALTELKRLKVRRRAGDAAMKFDVPTLAELLQFTNVPLALELKDARFANVEDAQRLIDVLVRHAALQRCVLVSFHLPLLQRLKSLAPCLPIGMITLSNPFPLYPTEFIGPFFPLMYLNPLYVWWARRLGKLTSPLDPSPEPRLRYYRRLGVPVLLTNHPGVTKRALNEI